MIQPSSWPQISAAVAGEKKKPKQNKQNKTTVNVKDCYIGWEHLSLFRQESPSVDSVLALKENLKDK